MSFAQPVDLAPGRYTLETAVVDREGNRASAKRSALVVEAPRGAELSNVAFVRRMEPPADADAADPFQFQNRKITLELAATSHGEAGLYFVIYPAKKLVEKPVLSIQFSRDGVAIANETPPLPESDGSGAMPMVIQAKFSPGEYQARIQLTQGNITSERIASFVVEP